MKSKFTLLLLLTIMTVGMLPTISVVSAEEDGVPSAKFDRLTVDGETLDTNIVKVNTTVKIQYTADRLKVDGVVLLGVGNNLTENVEDAVAANFSLVEDNAQGPTKFFSIEVNVTEFMKFYAYSWKDNYTNGTPEEFNSIDEDLEGRAYHHIWIEGEEGYPIFEDVIGAEKQDPAEDYIAPLGTSISIRYTVSNPNNESSDRIATLSISDNQTNVLNRSRSTFINMTWVDYDNVSKVHTFEYNMTITKRVIFFTAFNSKGFERTSPQASKVHRISTEFSFSADYESFDANQFSDIDNIYTNVTAINKTVDDRFFMRYRIANDTDDITEANWTDVELFNITTPTIYNSSISNDTVTIYAFDLNMTLNYSKQIELQVYVKYFNYTEYRPSVVFDVYDSRPDVEIFGKDFRYSNKKSIVIEFSAKVTKGELDTVELKSVLNGSSLEDTYNVKNKDGLETKANETVSLSVEGVYIITLNATSTFNRSRVIEISVHADFTTPTGSISLKGNASESNSGLVELVFTYGDNALNDSGVDKVYLDWGNGLVEDVTGKNSSVYEYTRGGEYQVVLTVWDKAGNNNTFALTVVIPELVDNQNTSTQNAPFSLLGVLFGISTLVFLKRKSKF